MVHLGPNQLKKKGTFTDVSPQLLEALKPIQEQFTISADKLRAIVKHFISELDRGLSKAGGNIL